jgi:hypothetical protein
MDNATNLFPRRFVFHGNAVAAEVFLTRIGETEQYLVQPVDGQSSLPVIGGYSESIVETPILRGELAKVFAYRQARTMADGRLDPKGTSITKVQASVADVRVTNQPSPGETDAGKPIVFTADALALSMLSTCPPDANQPTIEFVDGTPRFQGLFLAGLPIELELNVGLMQCSRWDDLANKFRTVREFFDNVFESFARLDPERPPAFGDDVPFVRGAYALCSFVRSIRWDGRTIPGHVLALPGFGAIYFGEMLLNDREWRVTMVRMRLGSNNAGQAVFAETDPNGTIWPPRTSST